MGARWYGKMVSSERISKYLIDMEGCLPPKRIHYSFATPIPPEKLSRRDWRFRVVLTLSGSSMIKAPFDGKISSRLIGAEEMLVGVSSSWQFPVSDKRECTAISLIWFDNMTRIICNTFSHGQDLCGETFHLPAVSDVAHDLIKVANMIAQEKMEPNRDTRMILLIRLLICQLQTDIRRQQTLWSEPYSLAVRQARHYMQSNFFSPISCSTVCAEVGINRSVLSTLFHRQCGVTMKQFLLDLRIEKARELLLDKEKIQISEVAGQCGFTDARYFASVFRHATGILPSEYRKLEH